MYRFIPAVLCLLTPLCAYARVIQGQVNDASGAAVPGAHAGLYTATGVAAEQITGADGVFRFNSAPDNAVAVVVTSAGFRTKTVPIHAGETSVVIALEIAPFNDSVRVAGSLIDVPASEQASSTSIITSADLRERNDAQAIDLFRFLPGLTVEQSGPRGGLTTLSIRGGDTGFALVEIDGMPVNSFNNGGLFDFSPVMVDELDHVEIVRGAQSALYGSYANSGVVNFVTRTASAEPAFNIVAEGGSHDENRAAVDGSGTIAGWGVAAGASRIADNGEVPNADWRDDNVMLHITRNWTRQSFGATGFFDSYEIGDVGPYGSDPAGLYTGLDLISRGKNNDSSYNFHYQADLTPRIRAELFGGFFLGNSYFISPFGDSFNKDIRGTAEGRLVGSVTSWWTMAGGYQWNREEVKNTFVANDSFAAYPLRRDDSGIYWENQFQFHRLYLQAGVRGEILTTPAIPGNPYGSDQALPSHSDSRVNPKVAAAYSLGGGLKAHASFGTGIRPPGASELAFTNNPDLKPERNTSVDAGIGGYFWNSRLRLDATFFYNRYSDLIVSLGGNLANLSFYQSDNLANARSRGLETSAELRPARWITFLANYTYLDTEVLALNHTGVAQAYYSVGQLLPRRPPQSGSFRVFLQKGHLSGDLAGYVRGQDLDVEPNYGVSEGFYLNPGYAYLEANLNVAVGAGATLYGTLRNALDQRYEEVFGFPSPRLNFVSGVKWSFRGKQ